MANYTQRPAGIGTAAVVREGFFKRILHGMFPRRGDGAGEVIRKIVFLVALIAFIVTGGSLLWDVGTELWQKYIKTAEIQNLKAEGSLNLSDDEIKKIQEEVPDILPEYMGLYSQNNDFVGWLKMDGTVIDYPVVQGDDNEHYLTTAFTGEYNKGGTIFADYRNSFAYNNQSDNIILYGHNIWSGAYFTMITRYLVNKDVDNGNTSFYKEHPTIEFDTLYGKGTYKIFAYSLLNTESQYGEVFDYMSKQTFKNAEDFNNYIVDIMDRSRVWTDVDLQYGDDLLTLSTCFWPYGEKYDTRCVIFARKVREGESTDVNTDAIEQNPSPLMWEYDSIYAGNVWGGSKWLEKHGDLLLSYTAPAEATE